MARTLTSPGRAIRVAGPRPAEADADEGNRQSASASGHPPRRFAPPLPQRWGRGRGWGQRLITGRPHAERAETTARRLALSPLSAVVILGVIARSLAAWADFDAYWHLADGRAMVRDGRFPSPDRFSWSAAGMRALLNSVDYDRLLYGLWVLGGGRLIALATALVLLAALLPVARALGRIGLHPLVEAGAMLLLMAALLPYTGARPHWFGVAIFVRLLGLVARPWTPRRGFAAGALLGLWANLHGSFPLGFLLVGVAGAVWLLDDERRAAGLAGGALALGFALSLLSPYRLALWEAPIGVINFPRLTELNGDWSNLKPFELRFAPMAVIILLAVVTGIWSRRDPRAITAGLLLLPLIQFARLTPFAAPLLLMLIAAKLPERLPRLALLPASPLARTAARPAMARVAWTVLAVGTALLVIAAPSVLAAAGKYPVPTAAMDRLLACGQPGPVWATYNWGGYVIWRGDGRYPVGMDGRAEALYPAAWFARHVAVELASAGWETIVQTSPADYALIPANAAARIGDLPGWREVYRDDLAVVAARDGAAWGC